MLIQSIALGCQSVQGKETVQQSMLKKVTEEYVSGCVVNREYPTKYTLGLLLTMCYVT